MGTSPQCQHFAVFVSIALRESVDTNVVLTQNCLLLEIWTFTQYQPSGEIYSLALKENVGTNLACRKTLEEMIDNLLNSSRYGYCRSVRFERNIDAGTEGSLGN